MMPKTIEITLKINVRKLSGEEIEEQGFDNEDVREFDVDTVDKSDLIDALNGYFENALNEFSGEIMCEVYDPYTISKITAITPPAVHEVDTGKIDEDAPVTTGWIGGDKQPRLDTGETL